MVARNALDRMKQQGSVKAKENRTKRKVDKNKEYGKSGLSSSDMAYINGNYKKVASNKAYGYRQGVKKGEIVRGTDSDWLSDGNIRRTTKVKENESWKNPTNKKGRQKYAILSSHKWDKAKNFNEQLNTGTLDGLKTAKANQRKGKHISNALELLKGGAKDVIVDPAVDFMKSVGAIGSYGLAGLSGIAEDSGNLAKAISDPKRTYKDYSQGRSNFKENLKANKEALDKTGFGESMTTFLHDAKKRGEEETIRLLKEDGRGNEVKSYKEQIEKNKKRDTNLLNTTGFAMELTAPTVVEDKVVDVVKGLGKNTVKSFKELKNGIANLATGIVPEETAKLMANSKKYAGKGITGASDDVFFSGTKGKTATDKLLDNQFEKTMDNVKDIVKKNPNTSNLGKFLDTLDDKPLKGTQRKIDGRTLNKKYTQTKDGYIPNLMNSVDEVGDVAKEFAQSQQFSMFGKNGSIEGYLKQLKDPYARYENILEKYNGDIDGLAEKLDSMKPQNAKEVYDYLMKRKPNLYKELTKGSDDVTNLMLKNDKYNLRNISDELSSIDKIKELNKGYNQLNERRLLESINGKQEKIGARLKVSKGKQIFKDVVGEYLFGKLPNKSVDELEHVSGLFNNMINMLDNKEQTHIIAKQLNALLFDGQDVIRNNMPRSSMRDMVEYFDDIVNYQKAVGNGEMSVKFRYRDLPKEYNIYAKDGNMNLTKNIDFSAKFSPSAVDTSFETKRQDIASKLGVKYKSDIDNPLNEYWARKNNGEVLTEQEFRHFKDLQSRRKLWDDLYSQVKDLDPKEYEEFARKKFSINKGYNDALDELAEKQARIDSSKGKENILKEAQRNLELGSDPNVTASPRSQNLLHNGNVDEWEQMTKGNTTGNIKDIPFKQYKQNYSKDLGLNYVNTKYPIQIRKEKQTLQGVRSYKPVDTAISNLEKLMNKEVALTIKGNVNSREYETLRTLVKENVQRLEELGVSKNTYFNHIKQLKMNLLKDGQVSANTRGVKPMSGKVKNTTKGINPLEMAHIKINGNVVDNIDELTPDQLQWKYLMTEGAKTIDELFDAMPGSIPQRGDNLGNEISSMLGGKNNIQTLGDVNVNLNKTNNPFDELLKQKQNTSSQFNNTKIGEQTNIFDMFDNKDFQPNEDYVHLPDLLKEQNNFPVNGDFDVLDLLKPNIDKDSQIDMLGYITGQKIDVDKKSLYKSKKKRRFNTVDELDDTSFNLPKIPNQLDSGSFKQFADKLYELGINPYQKPPKTKPNNMPNEIYEYWNEFSNKVLSDDVSKKGINELKVIDEHISKNSKELAKPTKTTPDKSLENLNVYEDSMKNSTKTIHKNIDEYNKFNKYVDDVNIDNYMGATNKISNEGVPTFEQFKETVSKNSNGKLPYKDNEIYDIYKRWLNSYKKGLTVYNPGWWLANFLQNKGQNYLAFGVDALKPQTEAKNIIRKMKGRNYKDINVFDSKNKISYSMDDIAKLAQEFGVIDGLGEDVRSARGIFSRLETQIDNSGFMKRLSEIEETARMHHFVKQLEKGMSPEDASKSVNKYLFDYSKKNKVDDFIGDFVDPFWTFHKNNAKLMYGSMFEHPGKINSIIRGTRGLENGIPEEQRQNEEFKYGKLQKPYANFTDSVNGDQYNYLYKQNMFPDVEDAIPLDDEALENKMNPLVRMLMQQSRGEGNFGNKIVEEGENPGWNEITKEQRMKEVIMDLNPFMPNLVKTLDSVNNRQQKADEGKQSQETSDKQILMDWINYITGNKGNWYRNLDL